MDKISVADARKADTIGRQVRLQGWVRTRRDSKGGFSFIELNDGSCQGNVQVVAPGELANYDAVVKKLPTGASVCVDGEVKASPAKGQATEVLAARVELLGDADVDSYPLQKKGHSFEFLRGIAHLRPRTNTFGAVARVRHQVSMSIHQFFHERGFYYVHTPIITASDCEGAGELFRVTTIDLLRKDEGRRMKDEKNAGAASGPDSSPFAEDFFHKPAYLTVSGQLQGETFACALGKIYTFGPTFRAENSNTPRHLAEFWMIEPEMAFYELTDNMDLAEAFLKRIISDALKFCMEDLKFFAERLDNNKELFTKLENVLNNPFQRVSYTEGIDIL